MEEPTDIETELVEEDADAGYDQKKIDDAFPPVNPDMEEKRPPIVFQHVTLTYADGRTATFTGKAVMTMAEWVDGRLRLIDVVLSPPQVVAVQPTPETEQKIASMEQAKEAIDAAIATPAVMGAIEDLGKK